MLFDRASQPRGESDDGDSRRRSLNWIGLRDDEDIKRYQLALQAPCKGRGAIVDCSKIVPKSQVVKLSLTLTQSSAEEQGRGSTANFTLDGPGHCALTREADSVRRKSTNFSSVETDGCVLLWVKDFCGRAIGNETGGGDYFRLEKAGKYDLPRDAGPLLSISGCDFNASK